MDIIAIVRNNRWRQEKCWLVTAHTHTRTYSKNSPCRRIWILWQPILATTIRFSISNPLHSKDIMWKSYTGHPWCAFIEDQANFFFFYLKALYVWRKTPIPSLEKVRYFTRSLGRTKTFPSINQNIMHSLGWYIDTFLVWYCKGERSTVTAKCILQGPLAI